MPLFHIWQSQKLNPTENPCMQGVQEFFTTCGSLGGNQTLLRCVFPCSKCCSAELPLRAGLIHAAEMCQVFMHLRRHTSPALNGSSALQHFEHGNMQQNNVSSPPGLPHVVKNYCTPAYQGSPRPLVDDFGPFG